MASQTLTLSQLRSSARTMGYPAEIVGTGGNVVALSVTINHVHALIGLGDGVEEDDTWNVSLDGISRETFGEWETDELPVTSDADQTITDAAAWLTHIVCDAPISDDTFHGYGCGCIH
ncbi:MAG: hypothetical protein JWQ03_3251 [Variovorax sp.]|nr:hypothetical protein [Variovorax sp.]